MFSDISRPYSFVSWSTNRTAPELRGFHARVVDSPVTRTLKEREYKTSSSDTSN